MTKGMWKTVGEAVTGFLSVAVPVMRFADEVITLIHKLK